MTQPGPPATGRGLAMASFVLGVLPVLPVLGSVLAIALGLAAIRRLPASASATMAWMGIIVGSLWLLLFIALLVAELLFGLAPLPGRG